MTASKVFYSDVFVRRAHCAEDDSISLLAPVRLHYNPSA